MCSGESEMLNSHTISVHGLMCDLNFSSVSLPCEDALVFGA